MGKIYLVVCLFAMCLFANPNWTPEDIPMPYSGKTPTIVAIFYIGIFVWLFYWVLKILYYIFEDKIKYFLNGWIKTKDKK